MTIDAGDVVKCTARMEVSGGIAVQNTFFAKSLAAAPIDDQDAMDDLAAWLDAMYDHIDGNMTPLLSFVDIQFHEMVANRPIGTEPWPTMTVGGSGADPTASGVALGLTAHTLVNRVRGRKSIGVLSDTDMIALKFAGGVLTVALLFGAAWITPFAGSVSGETWTPGVWRRKTSTFVSFKDVVVRTIPWYQRRRAENVGI